MLDQIHRCTSAGKLRSRRRKTRLENGQLKDLQHLQGRGCFLPNKDARNDQNAELDALEHKKLTDFICEYIKRCVDGSYPGWGRRCSISMQIPNFSTVIHRQLPFAAVPTTCTPQLLSLLHHSCLELRNSFPRQLSCSPEPKNIPAKMVPRETVELQSFTAHISDKVFPISLLKAAIMVSPALQLAIKHLIVEDFGKCLHTAAATRSFWPHKPCQCSLCFA